MAVFVGAGVSMCPPSSLPGWTGLKAQILDSILHSMSLRGISLLRDIGIDEILRNSTLSPEVVLSALSHQGLENLKLAFSLLLNSASPNLLHTLIAKMAKCGLVRIIVTTNFDTLLEQALTLQGVAFVQIAADEDFHEFFVYGLKQFRNPHFKVAAPTVRVPSMVVRPPDPAWEAEIKRKRQRYDVPVAVVKLHGTIEKPHTMLFTAEETAERLPGLRLNVLRFALCQYFSLYMGYSGRDLDIAPSISHVRMTYDTIEKKTLRVLAPFDQYDEESIPEEVFHFPELSARKAYWVVAPHEFGKSPPIAEILSTYGSNGKEIPCDLLDLAQRITSLMDGLDFRIKDTCFPAQSSCSSLTSENVDAWANGLSTTRILLAISELLWSKLDQPALAESVAQESERHATDEHERLRALRVRLRMSLEKGQKVQSIDLLRQLKRIAYTLGADIAIEFRLDEGRTLLELGLPDEAEKAFAEIASVSSALVQTDAGKLSAKSRDYALRALNGLAACDMRNGLLEHAIAGLECAKHLLEETRHHCEHPWDSNRWSSLRATTASNLAYCYAKQGKKESAHAELLVALDEAASAQEPDSQLLILERLVRSCLENADMQTATLYMQRADRLRRRGINPVTIINMTNERKQPTDIGRID